MTGRPVTTATFDQNDHAVTRGWATAWEQPYRFVPWFRQIRCRLLGHQYPTFTPEPPNGHSPSNLISCRGCGTLLKFYVEGQHRWGSYDRHIFEAYRARGVL